LAADPVLMRAAAGSAEQIDDEQQGPWLAHHEGSASMTNHSSMLAELAQVLNPATSSETTPRPPLPTVTPPIRRAGLADLRVAGKARKAAI
jgi:hypothetical protein